MNNEFCRTFMNDAIYFSNTCFCDRCSFKRYFIELTISTNKGKKERKKKNISNKTLNDKWMKSVEMALFN
jgi:hypothetical protein